MGQKMKSVFVKCNYTLMQGCYWSMYCIIYGYAVIYLSSSGISSGTIGVILAISNLFSIFIQWVISNVLLDRGIVSLKKAIQATGILVLSFSLLHLGTLRYLPVSVFAFSVAMSLVLVLQPFVNAVAFEYISCHININFGLSRGMGSLAFALTSLLAGMLLTKHYPVALMIFFSIIAGLFIITGALLLGLPQGLKSEMDGAGSNNVFSKYHFMRAFIPGVILLFGFHTIITNYIAPIIYSFNGGNQDVSVALMIAGCVEIPVILFFSILIKRISVISLVTYSAIFFVLRNILLLLSGSVSMVLFSQSFQAFSFALFIPASAYFMHQFTMPADNVRAQTILSIAMTSGGVLGSIMGGVLLEFIDINRILFLSLFVVSGGLWLIIKGLRSKKLYNGGESQRII
ncbi:TPA: MFS transporter [Escherichia coli]|uniref:MFS transporter n=3 Tax=Escherichia coli TaxID=562 RepID=UPI000BC7E499|nr:MFS transporter [Escherichia coli]EAZ5076279.1 MFS transporter [Salmonella enterica]EBY0587419.1 hypothetical protein [Salmonella enterica subsp. enterica serovar Glostrup]EFM6626279.1 MFS transporter [Escherichia coli]PCO96808.1 hypothetical protein CP996_19625 [Escherichia coli]RZV84053.1 hypothetical protein EXX84_22320 [Escherichia coli]